MHCFTVKILKAISPYWYTSFLTWPITQLGGLISSQGLVVVCLISPKKVQDPTLWEKPFLFIFGRKMVVFSPVCFVCFVLFVAILRPILAYLFFKLKLSSTEKDAVMYLYSTMDRFRTVGISRVQFWLILQIRKDAIELTSRQEVRLR